jgi:hypothetical protein
MRVALLLIALTSIASADPLVLGTSLTLQRGAGKPIALRIAKSTAGWSTRNYRCGALNIRLAPKDVPFQSFDFFDLDPMMRDSQPAPFRARTSHGVNVTTKRGGVTRFIWGEKPSVEVEVDGTAEVDGVAWRLRGRITVAEISCAWD